MDAGVTNLATKNADLQQFRGLCLATVDAAAESVRANMISTSDVQAQIIMQSDAIPAAIAQHDSAINIGTQTLASPIEPYVGGTAPDVLSFTLQNGNNVTLGENATGLRVGVDGWYQVSFAIGAPSAGVSDVTIGLSINGDATSVVPLRTVTTTNTFGHVSGSTLMNLIAGDVVQIFLIGTALGTFTVADPANADVRLNISLVGP